MNKYYQERVDKLRKKYVPGGKLETEPMPRTPQVRKDAPASPSKHETDKIAEYKRLFHLPNGLEIEGLPEKVEQTVAEYCQAREREERIASGGKLLRGRTEYQGEPMFLYVDIRF